ncbi:MAG: cytochrome c biogenesis protein CcdA [Candidatus Nitrosotenuis sp.]
MVQPAFAETIQYQALGIDGKQVNLADYHGKAVMLNGWATWCTSCKEEMPKLEKLHQEFESQGFTVIGVSTDNRFSDGKVVAVAEQRGVTYPIWRDPDDRFTPTFRAIGLPHTVLFDRDGNVVQVWKGEFNPLSDESKHYVNVALGNLKSTELKDVKIQDVGFVVAFTAGILSFLLPCVLPLIPVYVTSITGLSLKEISTSQEGSSNINNLKMKRSVIINGGLFIAGFSTVFMAMGASVGFVSSWFIDSSIWIEKIGGILLIMFGLHLAGLLRIPKIERRIGLNFPNSSKRVGPYVIGMSVGAGWSPCLGPVLAGILALAAASSSAITGALLLGAYSLGHAIPFIICAIALDRFVLVIKKLQKRMKLIERITGGLMIGMGVLLLSGTFSILSSIFAKDIIPQNLQVELQKA